MLMPTRFFLSIFGFFLFTLIFVGTSFPSKVSAGVDSVIRIAPQILDFKGKIREKPEASFVVENLTRVRKTVYGFDQAFGSSATTSSEAIEKWLRYPHTIELAPFEKKNINFSVEIPPTAKSGVYHAKTVFSYGSTQGEAQARLVGAIPVVINVEVLKSGRQLLQLNKFIPKEYFFPKQPISPIPNMSKRAFIKRSLKNSVKASL